MLTAYWARQETSAFPLWRQSRQKTEVTPACLDSMAVAQPDQQSPAEAQRDGRFGKRLQTYG